MTEEINKILNEMDGLKKRLDKIENALEEDRQDLINQVKKISDIPESVLKNMTRCDLKQVLAKQKPPAEIPGTPREDEDKKYNPFAKPEGWF